MKFKGPGEQVKRARERLGKNEREMAAAIGIEIPSYYDVEECEGEVEGVLQIYELEKLFRVLHVTPTFVFRGERAPLPTAKISFADLAEAIKKYCQTHKITLQKFEKKTEWEKIDTFLENPNLAWKLWVDWLQDMCKHLKLDWVAILTTEIDDKNGTGPIICLNPP